MNGLNDLSGTTGVRCAAVLGETTKVYLLTTTPGTRVAVNHESWDEPEDPLEDTVESNCGAVLLQFLAFQTMHRGYRGAAARQETTRAIRLGLVAIPSPLAHNKVHLVATALASSRIPWPFRT